MQGRPAQPAYWPSTGAGRGQYAGSALLRNEAVGCTLCAYWAMCLQLFGLFRAKRAILSLHDGWRWQAAQSENQLDTGRFSMKGMHSRVLDSG